jgi:hypothetical protein
MDVVDRCVDMMGSVPGGGMMGTGTTMLVLLYVLLLFWLVGLAAVGAVGYWAVRKLRNPR